MKKEIRLDTIDLLTRKHMINQMYPKVKPKMGKEGIFYVQAVEDLERFFEDMEKGKTIDPAVIEQDIQALEKHLKAWQEFAKGKSAFPDDLKAMEEHLVQIQKEWKEEKGNMVAFYNATRKLDKALESGASEEEVMKLYQEVELLVND